MNFYLGTHQVAWLERTDVPLFLSYRRLADRTRLPAAVGAWALDSGGFTELSLHGRWETSSEAYADDVRRLSARIGPPDFVGQQDWLCAPPMLAATGLTVDEHQARTVENLLQLREIAPEIPWLPTLQGWAVDEYLEHAARFEAAGVRLRDESRVGVGSIAPRQTSGEVVQLFDELSHLELNLHGYGVKTGLARYARHLRSADSLSWSFRARKGGRPADYGDDGPPCSHASCSSCLRFALAWREDLLAGVDVQQMSLFERR